MNSRFPHLSSGNLCQTLFYWTLEWEPSSNDTFRHQPGGVRWVCELCSAFQQAPTWEPCMVLAHHRGCKQKANINGISGKTWTKDKQKGRGTELMLSCNGAFYNVAEWLCEHICPFFWADICFHAWTPALVFHLKLHSVDSAMFIFTSLRHKP